MAVRSRGHGKQQIAAALLGGAANLLDDTKNLLLESVRLVSGEVGHAETGADGVDHYTRASEGREGGRQLAGALDVDELGEGVAVQEE